MSKSPSTNLLESSFCVKTSFKLDENLGIRGKMLLQEHGFDAVTVNDQALEGTADNVLIEVCRVEKRCLITLDLDFANPLIFEPTRYAGIVVLRPGKNPSHEDLIHTLKTFISSWMNANQSLVGKLWIVSMKQIREYIPSSHSDQ